MFCRLKDFRRVATRYDCNAVTLPAAVCTAAAISYRLRIRTLGRPRPAGPRMTKGQSSLIGDLADDEQAAKYFEKQMGFDPDLWIVLIEDREGKVFMDGPVRYWTLASTREVTSANSAKNSRQEPPAAQSDPPRGHRIVANAFLNRSALGMK